MIQSTLDNSNLALTRTKINFPWISPSYIYCNFTLGNSNLPLTGEAIFVSPQVIFYIILPSIPRTTFVLTGEVETNTTVVQNIEFILNQPYVLCLFCITQNVSVQFRFRWFRVHLTSVYCIFIKRCCSTPSSKSVFVCGG